jgi:hypothetical protein
MCCRLRAHVKRLDSKILIDNSNPEYIITFIFALVASIYFFQNHIIIHGGETVEGPPAQNSAVIFSRSVKAFVRETRVSISVSLAALDPRKNAEDVFLIFVSSDAVKHVERRSPQP